MRLFASAIATLLSVTGHAVFINFNYIIPETCGNSNGSVSVVVGGGVPPYSFSWSNGAMTPDLIDVPGGLYTLTVTDDVGTVVSDQVSVPGYGFLPYSDGGSYTVPDGMGGSMWGGACAGLCNGAMAMPIELYGGTAPYTINWSASSPIDWVGMTPDEIPIYGGFCLGDAVTYTYSDAFGCTGAGSFTVIGVDSVPSIEFVHGACAGGANGRVGIYCPQMPWLPPSMQIYRNGNLVTWADYPLWPAQTVVQVQSLIAGDYELRMEWMGACPTVVPFTIPALAVPCGTVSGTVFLDDDQDCEPDAAEIRMPYQVLNIQPIDDWVLSGSNGDFVFALPNGSYTLEHSAPGIVPLCPLPQPVPFTVNSNATVMQLADSSTAPLDIAVYMAGTVARPGFSTSHHATVRNLSAKPSGAAQVVHTFDPLLDYASASPAPTSVAGNAITWDLPELTAFEQVGFSIQFNVPVPTPLGTVLNSATTVTCALTDNDLSNNSAALGQTVTGSYDPNDKHASTSTGWSDALYYIDEDEWIDYTIRFQNTGTDTAFTVVITDTLAAELDMASFQQGTASHDFDVAFKPGRAVEWTFADILLPDSNVNEPASHGLISFRIRPRLPLAPGTQIENIANIFFDFNDPVITDPSVLSAELSTGVAAIDSHALIAYPNPTSDILFVIGESLGAGELLIRTLDGRSVMSKPVRSTRVALDVASLATGTYVIEARGADAVEVLLFNITR